jgi:hypothetical protein
VQVVRRIFSNKNILMSREPLLHKGFAWPQSLIHQPHHTQNRAKPPAPSGPEPNPEGPPKAIRVAHKPASQDAHLNTTSSNPLARKGIREAGRGLWGLSLPGPRARPVTRLAALAGCMAQIEVSEFPGVRQRNTP